MKPKKILGDKAYVYVCLYPASLQETIVQDKLMTTISLTVRLDDDDNRLDDNEDGINNYFIRKPKSINNRRHPKFKQGNTLTWVVFIYIDLTLLLYLLSSHLNYLRHLFEKF